MRLLNIHSLELHDFTRDLPFYAILSHRWANEKLSYQDYQDVSQRRGTSFGKIESCCQLLRGGKYLPSAVDYLWVDTVCIDKRSSSELSEAIKSMWNWYWRAKFCIAYLADVPALASHTEETAIHALIHRSDWFTRGWTLQELLAPKSVTFCNQDWQVLGVKSDTGIFSQVLSAASGIDQFFLGTGTQRQRIFHTSVAHRMSWAANRHTTRVEDMSYCLVGLFGVNMPLLYGEEGKAFQRSQHEIIRQTDDDSMFAWQNAGSMSGILASRPLDFAGSSDVRTVLRMQRPPMSITSRGLELFSPAVELETLRKRRRFVVKLNCARISWPESSSHEFGNQSAIRPSARGCLVALCESGPEIEEYFRWSTLELKLLEVTSDVASQKFERGEWKKIANKRFYVAFSTSDIHAQRNYRSSLELSGGLAFQDGDDEFFAGCL